MFKLSSFFSKLSNSFFIVLVLIQALLIILSVLFTKVALDITEKNEEKKTELIASFVSKKMEQESRNILFPAYTVTHNNEIGKAFYEKKRDKLLELSLPIWNDIHPLGIKQFQYNQKELITFLRVHNPGTFGEELTSYRPTVVKCITQNAAVYGLEQGKSGYGFRAVVPFKYQNELLGCIEFGTALDEDFLKTLNSQYPGKWIIYNLDRGVSTENKLIIGSTGIDEPSLKNQNNLPENNILDKIKAGKFVYFKNFKNQEITLFIPIRNFNEDIALFIKFIYPTDLYKNIFRIILLSVIIALIGFILSGIIIMYLYRQITSPMNKLVEETEKIKNFNLDNSIPIKASVFELRKLVSAVENMKKGLQSFRKYVPAQLVRDLILTNQEATVGGKRKEITIFFSDIADFTRISEVLTPRELTTQLSEYLELISNNIMGHSGTIDKYIGDAVMAFWGAPIELKDHAVFACKSALAVQKINVDLNKNWKMNGKPEFKTRIGINSGETIVGNIGSEQRLSYTVIGDSVNLASRLESLNKIYNTKILISESTNNLVKDQFESRIIDYVIVKGKTEPVTIFELIAEKDDLSTNMLEFVRYFNAGVMHYKNREWKKALQVFQKLEAVKKDDRPVKIFISRCNEFIKNPPPDDWKGVINVREK